MVITEVIDNTETDSGRRLVEGRHTEKVVLASADLVKRIQRVTTDHDRELGLRLPSGAPDLRDGDILAVEDAGAGGGHEGSRGNAVVVSVLPSDVLVIAARSIREMAFVAHSLGNRHLQAQFFGEDSEYRAEVMVVQYDHTVQEFLDHHRVPYSRQERVMPVPFRHAEHTH